MRRRDFSIDVGRLDVYADGTIARATAQGGEPDFVSLDGVFFWTDP